MAVGTRGVEAGCDLGAGVDTGCVLWLTCCVVDEELEEEELDEELELFEFLTAIIAAAIIAGLRISPLGSFHMTGLLIVYTYKLPACIMAWASGIFRSLRMVGLAPNCILCIFQNGSGWVNLPSRGLKLLVRKYPLQVSKLQYWSTKYQSVIVII